MHEPSPSIAARSEDATLDTISDHLAEVLRRADALLAEWSTFGVAVRRQVEREAAAIGDVVATAIDRAAIASTAASIDRAFADQLGARLTALTAELARLEARARGATHAFADERRGDRRVIWAVVAGVLVANALLLVLVLRRPPAAPLPPAPEAVRIQSVPVAVPSDAGVPDAAGSGSSAPGAGSGSSAPAVGSARR